MSKDNKQKALDYHQFPTPGKITVTPTKALTTQSDLALAYSPGVAAACEEIAADAGKVRDYTARGNLVAVITNGSAVLGLGAIGPLASKPVMEGKGVLFKKFAGVDVFDIEIDQDDPAKLVDTIASLAPTFGGINLEDIKAPECFHVERALRDRLDIPVFHDDQHGTAIICAAAVRNGLRIVGKELSEVKLVTSGAGAAGMACVDLLVTMGLQPENVVLTDREGVVYQGRNDLASDDPKTRYAKDTNARELKEVIAGADIFLGVSVGGILTKQMVAEMAESPIILALANPNPEIMPEDAKQERPDAIVATGRSDYPNQVNNVLCFPYIFRGALDVGATAITDEMKMAAVNALADLARREASDISAAAYGGDLPQFGPDYVIPQPFDPRLILYVAPAVAQAAMDSGVATRPIEDMDEYVDRLTRFVFRTGLVMKPMFDQARKNPRRVVYAEGEEEVVLRAVRNVLDDGLAKPILIARPSVLKMRLEKLGLNLDLDNEVEVVNPEDDPRFKEYWSLYHDKMERKGVTPDMAKFITRTRSTVIAALMVERGEADTMIAGVVGRHRKILGHVLDVIGLADGVQAPSSMSVLATEDRTLFVSDTHVNPEPTSEEIAAATIMAAERVRHFGKTPKVALVCHSDFGSHDDASSQKMRDALQIIRHREPGLEVEGEMKADTALMDIIRKRVFPNSRLTQSANLLVMPDQASAHIAFSMTRVVSEAVTIGPMVMGLRKPAHVITPTATVRRVVNMTAIAVCDAQRYWHASQRELKGL